MSIKSDTATRPHAGKGEGILWRLMGRELAAAARVWSVYRGLCLRGCRKRPPGVDAIPVEGRDGWPPPPVTTETAASWVRGRCGGSALEQDESKAHDWGVVVDFDALGFPL
jgi:hypothetical protein